MRAWAILAILALAGGCADANKSLTVGAQRRGKATLGAWNWRMEGPTACYRLTGEQLGKMEFAGQRVVGRVRVQYQKGLESQAQQIAQVTDEMMDRVQQGTGLELILSPRIWLLRVDRVPTDYVMRIKPRDPNELPMPLFVGVDDETPAAILRQNWLFPTVFFHEIAEVSLILRAGSGVVLGDLDWGWGPFKVGTRNGTRWFREGMADYAGFLAYEYLREREEQREGLAPAQCLYQHPFSCLDRVRTRLFSWHQRSSDRLNSDYYNAALGLFLLLREEFGEQALPQVIAETRKKEFLNGQDLMEITNRTLHTDVRRLVEAFSFPKIGIKTQPLSRAEILNKGIQVEQGLQVTAVEAKSPAALAAIQPGDVITTVCGTSITGPLDLEMALFGARHLDRVSVTIWRPAEGSTAVSLPIGDAATWRNDPSRSGH